MAKKTRYNIIFSIVAVVLSCLFMVVAVFAWYSKNYTPSSGGVGIGTIEDDDSGVYIKWLSGKDNPLPNDYDFRIYPEDKTQLGLVASKIINSFEAVLSVPPLNPIKFIKSFYDSASDTYRNDLLIGNYQRVYSVADVDDLVDTTYDFSIDNFLDRSPIGDDNDLKMMHKLAFLYQFAESNALLGTMSVKLINIGKEGTPNFKDYSQYPIELKIISTANPQESVMYSLIGATVPEILDADGNPVLDGDGEVVKHPILQSKVTSVSDLSELPTDDRAFAVEVDDNGIIQKIFMNRSQMFTVSVDYALGHNGNPPSPPSMQLTAEPYALWQALDSMPQQQYDELDSSDIILYNKFKAALSTKIFDQSKYRAFNYNFHYFQNMKLAFFGVTD